MPTTRWIMVRGDFAVSGLWNAEGGIVWLDDLPIDQLLRARIAAWQNWYEEEEVRNPGAPPWERLPEAPVAAYNAEGRALAHALKAALPPGWTVVAEDVDAWRRRKTEPSAAWLLELPGEATG